MNGETKLYTAQDIADMFGVKILTVYNWIWKGKLDAYKVGEWRITQEQLNAFLDASRRKPKATAK